MKARSPFMTLALSAFAVFAALLLVRLVVGALPYWVAMIVMAAFVIAVAAFLIAVLIQARAETADVISKSPAKQGAAGRAIRVDIGFVAGLGSWLLRLSPVIGVIAGAFYLQNASTPLEASFHAVVSVVYGAVFAIGAALLGVALRLAARFFGQGGDDTTTSVQGD